MDFVRSDDELAILVAHEMAHQLLDDEFARVTRYVEERKNPENLVYHGYVAARTLLMPRIIAELESMYSSATAESGYSRRSPTRARR